MSIKVKPHKVIRAIWDWLNCSGQLSSITLGEVKAFAENKGLTVLSIEEIKFGWNPQLEAIFLKTTDGTALYPRKKLSEIDVYNNNIAYIERYEEFWSSVDWFFPPYVPLGKIHGVIQDLFENTPLNEQSDRKPAQRQFESRLSSIYNLGNIIPITVQTLAESSAIAKHLPLIKESILAFYSGMKVVAIAGLIPIAEDILYSIIGTGSPEIDTVAKVNKSIDLANNTVTELHINNADWIPHEYIDNSVLKVMNERTLVLETIRSWLLNSFYAKTQDYDKHSGFNRHFFAHAKSDIWHNEQNFFRAIGLIQALAFVECFAMKESKVSIFSPEPDDRSESFRLEVFACMNTQFIKKHVLNKLQIENSLPFNPTASDDGWLLRSSKLSEKMDGEIVPCLKAKGWQCHSFTDPIKEGEYISVRASKGTQEIKVALLYTCATSNRIYKELDQTCDFILYQGSYYKQDSYAYGVTAEVLPLSAWIAPD